MDKIYDICCGIDVHKKLIVACLNHKRKKELREFGATTRELMELAEWLQKNECEIVAMESTGESRTRTENRCKGCRMDCRTAPARITSAELYPE